MAILKPDNVLNLGGVTVNEYLLTKHNPNRISMPSYSMEGQIIGVTVHNTDWITAATGTTPAEQYTRATMNGNMNSVRVHYYVDNTCAWQNLPLTLSSWHAADGNGNGNRKTISIECIMSRNYNDIDKKSEDNCAKLAAALLKKYNLTIDHLYTHTHWLNVRDGKRGSVDYLNTLKHPYKWCPAYILPHWQAFKEKVMTYMGTATTPITPETPTTGLKSIEDIAKEVISGKWGNGDERKKRLTEAGYNYNDVQAKVTELMNAKPAVTPKKSVDELAKEVIAGKWGNGDARKKALTEAGYNYNDVQAKVSELLKPAKKSIEEIAKEVIQGKWGNGTTRKNKLTAAGYNYTEVQKKVTELLKK